MQEANMSESEELFDELIQEYDKLSEEAALIVKKMKRSIDRERRQLAAELKKNDLARFELIEKMYPESSEE
jgi:hypothetical protein